MTESFFVTLRNEEAAGVYGSRAAARPAIANYIHIDPARSRSAPGYLPPKDYARRLEHII